MQIERVIGQRIRAIRKARGLNLEELARESGISKGLLSKIENAKVSSPISTYSNIAATLGIHFSDLIQGKTGGRLPRDPEGSAETGLQETDPLRLPL